MTKEKAQIKAKEMMSDPRITDVKGLTYPQISQKYENYVNYLMTENDE